MKRITAFLLIAVFIMLSFSGCAAGDAFGKLDVILSGLQEDYDHYRESNGTEPSKSVLDALDLMLDHFVSGLSTPVPSSIPNVVLDPKDDDAQDIVSNAVSVVSNESELEALILDSLKKIDTQVAFEVNGNWLDRDVLYDIIFYRIHDVYMIEAFGLFSYISKRTFDGVHDFYELTFEYIDGSSPDEIRDLRYQIESRAKQIVRDLNLGGKSDYEIVAAIDQYLCDNVYYPPEPYISHDFTPYGAIISGRAVCEGYARSVKILCDLCGVDCYFVTGYCGSDPVAGAHAWNLVRVEGKWYQLDTTWNDGAGNKDYFLVTDAFMSLSHTWDTGKYPASAQNPY